MDAVMKNLMNKVTALSVLALMSCPLTAQAAQTEITWNDTDSFRDIEASQNNNQIVFEQNVIETLTRYFNEASSRYLPADQNITLTVIDLDLAGDVNDYSGRLEDGRKRIVKDLYFPSITIRYQLSDANGNSLQEGEDTLKNMSFLSGYSRVISRESLDHEKRLIDRWFSDQFGDES
jgi:hypothetical protein